MKKQRIKGIVLVVVCFICVLCICSGFYRVQSKELSEIPDAVNSTRFNTTEHLTVVANQEEIADKKELAKQVLEGEGMDSVSFTKEEILELLG